MTCRLLTPEESRVLINKWRYDIEKSVEWLVEEVAKAQDAKTTSQELLEKITSLITEPRMVYYPKVGLQYASIDNNKALSIADQILVLVKEAGYVKQEEKDDRRVAQVPGQGISQRPTI